MIKEDEARLLRQTVDLAIKSASDASGRAQRAGRASMAACGAAAVAVAGAAFFGGMLSGSLHGGSAGNGFSAPVYAPVFAGNMPHASADGKGRTWDLPFPGKGKARRAMWMDGPDFVPAALESSEPQEPAASPASAQAEGTNAVPAAYDGDEDGEAVVEPAAARDRLQMVPIVRYRSYADRCRLLGQPVPEGTFCFDSSGQEMFCMRLSSEEAAAWDRWDLEAYRAEAAEKRARAARKAAPEQRRQAPVQARPEAAKPAPQKAQAPVQAPVQKPAAVEQPKEYKGCGSAASAAPAVQPPAGQAGQGLNPATPGVPMAPSPDVVIRGMAEPAGAIDAAIAARKGVKLPAKQEPSRPLAGSRTFKPDDVTVPAPRLSASEADIAVRLAKGPAVPVKRELSPLQKSGKLRAETSDPRFYDGGAKLSYSGFLAIKPEKLAETTAAAMAHPKIARERFDALLRDAPGIHLAGTPKEGRTALAVIVQPGCTACMAISGLLENQAANLPFPVYFIPANSQSALSLYPASEPDKQMKEETERLGDAAAKFLASTGRPLTPTYVWAMDGEVHAGTLKALEVTAVVGMLSAHARACGAKAKADEPNAGTGEAKAGAEAPKAEAAKAASGAGQPKDAQKDAAKAGAGKAQAKDGAASASKTENAPTVKAAPEGKPEAKAGSGPEEKRPAGH